VIWEPLEFFLQTIRKVTGLNLQEFENHPLRKIDVYTSETRWTTWPLEAHPQSPYKWLETSFLYRPSLVLDLKVTIKLKSGRNEN